MPALDGMTQRLFLSWMVNDKPAVRFKQKLQATSDRSVWSLVSKTEKEREREKGPELKKCDQQASILQRLMG